MSGEVAPTSQTGQAVATGGPRGQLEAATLTTANARQYYEDIATSVDQMCQRLQQMSDLDKLCVEQFRGCAAGLRTIVIKLEASIAAMRIETIDPSIIAAAVAHRATGQQFARLADERADAIEESIKTGRAKLRELGCIFANGARKVFELLQGYKRAEEAVQTSPLQMPDHTRVLGRQ